MQNATSKRSLTSLHSVTDFGAGSTTGSCATGACGRACFWRRLRHGINHCSTNTAHRNSDENYDTHQQLSTYRISTFFFIAFNRIGPRPTKESSGKLFGRYAK
jgi:hypothetical protein